MIQELVEERCEEIVWIIGDPGSGKSTALAHLAAAFANDDRLILYDEPKPYGIGVHDESQLVVATACTSAGRNGAILLLQYWEIDELLEFLLAVYPQSCKSVMDRLGKAAHWVWRPQLASIVLHHLANDLSLVDAAHALVTEIHERLPNRKHFSAAARFCLASLVGGSERNEDAARLTAKTGCPPEVIHLLRHPSIRLLLATESLVASLDSRNAYRALSRWLPYELVKTAGQECREKGGVLRRLEKLLESSRNKKAHPMAASILLQADPTWRPIFEQSGGWNLAGGHFPKAEWSAIELSGALLCNCDFTEATLNSAVLDQAVANGAVFDRADLSEASLKKFRGTATSFRGANLKGADFSQADISRSDLTGIDLSQCDVTKANLSGANLASGNAIGAMLAGTILTGVILDDCDCSGANFYCADLSHCDLRHTELAGTCFTKSNLRHAQMDDISISHALFTEAKLCFTHLTGSKLPGANLSLSDLTGAFLAEIEWEGANLRGADLRGATFHMGSSRSGLVGSPIAREGSMTGFYTDEREEMYFKRPEEIRKANLCGADLRGAKIDGVDFYLVDLRGAKIDPHQEKQIRSTGAIFNEG